VSDVSQKLGLDLASTAAGYSRLAASAKEAGLPTDELHKGFVGLSEALTVLHAPADEVNRILVQLDQGLSLGRIQMQDLRAISNSLPGVFGLVNEAFKGTGKSVQDMLKNGGIPAQEFFEKFTELLHEKYGPSAVEASEGLNASLNRLHTTIFGLETQPSGFVTSFTDAIHELNHDLQDPALQQGFENLIAGLGDVASWGVKALGAIGDFGAGIGILIAKMQGIPDANDQLATVNSQIADYRKEIAAYKLDLEAFPQDADRIKASITGLSNALALAEQHRKNLIQGGGTVNDIHGPTVVTPAVGVTGHKPPAGGGGSATKDQFQQQLESLQKQLESIQQLTNYEKVLADVTAGRIHLSTDPKIAASEKDQLLNAAAQVDSAKDFAQVQKEADQATQDYYRRLATDQAAAAKQTEQLVQKFRELADPNLSLKQELQQVSDLFNEGELSADDATAASRKLLDQINGVTDGAKEGRDWAQQMGLTFTSSFENAITSGEKFSDVLKSIFADIEKIVIRQTITQPLGGALSKIISGITGPGAAFGGITGDLSTVGVGGFISGGLAGGGSAQAGKTYLIGENGPELLRMGSQSGTVIPNDQLGVSGPAVNITSYNSFDARGADPSVLPAISTMLQASEARTVEKAKAAIQAEISKGGAWARLVGRRR
jgi:tape measure domain-containing protein